MSANRTDTRYQAVPDAAALAGWLERPGSTLLFLHDPGCPVSRRAYDQVAQIGGEVALIDVDAVPSLADEVERRTGVRHESPQAIVLRNGEVAWAASHFNVTARAIAEAMAVA